MVDRTLGRLRDTDQPVLPSAEPAVGDSVLAVRAVVAMCTLSARSHAGIADVVGTPEVATEESAGAPSPLLRVRLEVVAEYGAELHRLADDVRGTVARTLTEMTGLEVAWVDVVVTDVAAPAD